MLLETRKNATVIPSAAVQRGPQGNYVYVVNPQNKAEVRQVSIAITEGNLAQITSGVSPDERVVTDGQDKLQPGSEVQPHLLGASADSGNQNAGNPGTTNSSNSNGNAPGSNPGRRSRNRQTGPPNAGKSNTGTTSQ